MNIPYVFKRCNSCGEWLVASNVNFYKNKGCKYGLINDCKKCRKEQDKQRYKVNKDKILEQKKQYYGNNKDKIVKLRKQYREENEDKIAEQKKQYYEANKDEILEHNRQYRENNKDKIIKQQKQYRENNKDKIAERGKQYYKNNKDKIIEKHKQYYLTPQGKVSMFNGNNRRRLKEKNQGNGITPEQWLECMKYFNFKCAYSGETLKDNTRSIDHIKPLNQGGEHEVWNLVPMDKGLNSSKNDNNLLEWYQEQDFYSEDRLQKIYEWQEYAFNKWHKEEIV